MKTNTEQKNRLEDQPAISLKIIKEDKEIQETVKQIPTIVERANVFLLDSNEKLGTASEAVSYIRKRIKLIEDRKKELLAPLKEFLKGLNDFFAEWINPLMEAEKIMSDKMVKWRRLENERIQKENQKLLEKAEKKAEKKGDVFIPDLVPLVREQTTATSAGRFDKKWTFEVVDQNVVPIKFLMVNDMEVRKAIREGVRGIRGIRIFEQEYFVRN